MDLVITSTKLIFADVEKAEAFYVALGFKVLGRRTGDFEDPNVAQKQVYISATGEGDSHQIILANFYKLPPPREPVFPCEAWIVMRVPDVDALIVAAEQTGGKVVTPAQNRPEFSVCSAIVSDPGGHLIEVIGPARAE